MRKVSLTVAACATLLWTGAVYAKPKPPPPGPTCTQRQSQEGSDLTQKQQECTDKLTRYGCDVGVCSLGLNECAAERDQCVNTDLPACRAELAQCLPARPLKTGQTTSYGTGSDGAVQAGVSRSYTDNGDGTITDNKTGLMWEKKDQAGGIHDWSNYYTWSGASYGSTNIMDGTITTAFLATLNAGGGFAGHTDWRIPNQNELLSLVNYENVSPSVDAAFNTSCAASCTVLTCSCTQSSLYWSSTTYRNGPDYAWDVFFYDGYDYAILRASATTFVQSAAAHDRSFGHFVNLIIS
jgi:hypothetical protein